MDLKDVVAKVRTAISLAQTLKQADIVNQLVDVQAALLEAFDDRLQQRDENQRQRGENERLAKRVEELESALAFSRELIYHDGLYHVRNSEGLPTGEPYCPACWDAKRLAIHVTWQKFGDGYTCGHCKFTFMVDPRVL
jgi:ribosomal protein S27AE